MYLIYEWNGAHANREVKVRKVPRLHELQKKIIIKDTPILVKKK